MALILISSSGRIVIVSQAYCASLFFSFHTVLHLLFSSTPQVSYKKDAKASLHYTPVADRPDIKKATQAAKLISDVIKQHMHKRKTQLAISRRRLRYKYVPITPINESTNNTYEATFYEHHEYHLQCVIEKNNGVQKNKSLYVVQ